MFGEALTIMMILTPLIGQGAANIGLGFIAMGIATGLACFGAGIAVASTGTAAIASITEKPETFARSLIFVGLAEGIAIYGLLVALLVWIQLPALL
ncbi:hypothetical protein DRO24_00585 [Candidatus Bathyarchaeota archaeon]|nr:MAG: hypothetical protein DRO24_00585 [Candidatus Bathyarchaeota archaeon]